MNFFQVQQKPLELTYMGEKIKSDGGLLLLKELENQIGIIDKINDCKIDRRDPRYIEHSQKEMLCQRIFQIAAGYEDTNDCNTLKNDAILKLCADKLPVNDGDLGSQPTMSRFENR